MSTKEGNSSSDAAIIIALAGNANVGKSAIFNQLTGLKQETGNWAGKTTESAQGMLVHHGNRIRIVDLPGIYSFATYSTEEVVSREFITSGQADVVINVVDATSLERNLFFTLQLIEMNVPVVVALNLVDAAKQSGVSIDAVLLRQLLGVPVIKTVATKGIGVHESIDAALGLLNKTDELSIHDGIRYGPEVESRVSVLANAIALWGIKYPPRWAALKLLEHDEQITAGIRKTSPAIIESAQKFSDEIAATHGEDSASVIAAERYAVAARIAKQVSTHSEPVKSNLIAKLDNISMHPIAGYVMLFAVMLAILVFISLFGGWLTDVIANFFGRINPHMTGRLPDIFWNGGVVGFYASLSVALGFIFPFYIILGVLEQSGYLPRFAFLMDRPCHSIGLHGQASMPLLLALGCSVPACLSCRIMENRRDRLIATFLTTLIPCSARTSVILGLVGAFVGWQWAVGLYLFQFALVFLLGRIINEIIPGTSPGFIMEIPEYRIPSLKIVLRQAWNRFRDFLAIGVPLIIAGSIVIESLRVFNLIDNVTNVLAPLTVTWLGLPAFTGVLFIFGILRKEAALALLVTFAGGVGLASVMSPLQMVVFTIVLLLYIPCISTIAVIVKEQGVGYALLITITEIGLALLTGGLAFRLLKPLM